MGSVRFEAVPPLRPGTNGVAPPPASEGSLITAERLADEMSKVHRFGVQETWDWWQDWHLALWTENLDAVLVRLLPAAAKPLSNPSGTTGCVQPEAGTSRHMSGASSPVRPAWSRQVPWPCSGLASVSYTHLTLPTKA